MGREFSGQLGENRFVLKRRVGELRAGRFGGVLANAPVHFQQFFGLVVPGCQLAVIKGPAESSTFAHSTRLKVFFAEPQSCSPVELRATTYVVVGTGAELLALAVNPFLGGVIAVFHSHFVDVPVFLLLLDKISALYH